MVYIGCCRRRNYLNHFFLFFLSLSLYLFSFLTTQAVQYCSSQDCQWVCHHPVSFQSLLFPPPFQSLFISSLPFTSGLILDSLVVDQTYNPLLPLSLPLHVQSTFSLPHSQKSRPFPALFVICLWSSLSLCLFQYHFFSLCLSCLFLLLTVCIDHSHFNLISPLFFCPYPQYIQLCLSFS